MALIEGDLSVSGIFRQLHFWQIVHVSNRVGSKLKCPLFVASEMSGFKVVPSPVGLGWFWGWGAGEGGNFPFPCSALY
jgi:hypothetical protein